MSSEIKNSMKEVRPGQVFTIVADEETEDLEYFTMLDPRIDEGDTEIGPVVNVSHAGLLGGHLVLRDAFGPVRIIR